MEKNMADYALTTLMFIPRIIVTNYGFSDRIDNAIRMLEIVMMIVMAILMYTKHRGIVAFVISLLGAERLFLWIFMFAEGSDQYLLVYGIASDLLYVVLLSSYVIYQHNKYSRTHLLV